MKRLKDKEQNRTTILGWSSGLQGWNPGNCTTDDGITQIQRGNERIVPQWKKNITSNGWKLVETA